MTDTSIFMGLPLLEDIGYAAVFVLMAGDGANIPFTPSELFLAFTGYLARTDELRPVVAYTLGLLGSLTGNGLSYYAGKHFGRPLCERYGSYIFLTPDRLRSTEARVKKFGSVAPLVIRFIPGLRNVGSLILGTLRVPPGSFFLLTAAGLAIYNAVFFLLGYALAEQTANLKMTIFIIMMAIMVTGLVLAGASWIKLRRQEREET